MLKNLLPKINLKEKSENPQKLKSSVLNLLDTNEPSENYSYFLDSPLVKASRTISIIMVVGFILLLSIYNFLLQRINAKSESLDRIEMEIAKLEAIDVTSSQLAKATQLHKDFFEFKTNIAEKLELTTNTQGQNITLDKLSYKDGQVVMEAKAESAVNFAYLFTNYLKNDQIKEIVLKSVDFDTNTKQYVANFSLNFDEN